MRRTSKRSRVILVAAAVAALTALPLAAQVASARSASAARPRTGIGRQVFVPGFGFRPVIHERFPVPGLGFDAHHFSVLNRHHAVPFHPHKLHRGFVGGGFFGTNLSVGGFFPFFSSPLISSTSVVVVPQVVPVQVPVMVPVEVRREDAPGIVVTAGLPQNWPRLRIARDSYPRQHPPLAQLTLLVLKDGAIFAATDYWLEDGHIFYVTSTGRQDSLALRDLDWGMTTRLNAQRNVEFALRSER
ncbi:MAG: hypothetical protein ACE5IP_08520 [Terriglobia bacterium]